MPAYTEFPGTPGYSAALALNLGPGDQLVGSFPGVQFYKSIKLKRAMTIVSMNLYNATVYGQNGVHFTLLWTDVIGYILKANITSSP